MLLGLVFLDLWRGGEQVRSLLSARIRHLRGRLGAQMGIVRMGVSCIKSS